MQRKFALVLVLFWLLDAPWSASAKEGKDIGTMYQCAHGVRGRVVVHNEREITLVGFNYDGRGPAAWFHAMRRGAKGVHASGKDFVIIPYPDASCSRLKTGKTYKDDNVTLILPDSIKEYVTIGAYCYEYCHNFGHIVIPEDLDVPPAPENLLKVERCTNAGFEYGNKGCDKSSTKHGEIKPDCTAKGSLMRPGALQIVPAAVIAIYSTIVLVLSYFK